ncbi:MAG: bifunctional DNA primase/polymerase, partial [Synergistaceae bacterium]|nr:bifunctional DNA primase/polymerase [Synergistaceae bacterium]
MTEPMTWYKGRMRTRAEVERLKAEEAGGAGTAPESDKPVYGLSPIPEQLHGCRFILVKARDKPAIEKGWQTTANYAYDDPRLVAHIAAGGNYGVMPAGGVCILDADQTMRLAELGVLDRLLDTFVVKTGRTEGQGSHFYVYCPDAPAEKHILRDPEAKVDLGDLRGSGHPSFCVGPGCTHPSGGRYEVANDAPL